MIYIRLLLILFLNTILAGCSNIPTNTELYDESFSSQKEYQDPLSTLMLDYTVIENLDPNELAAIFNSVKEKFLSKKKDQDRIRYTLLLTLPEQEFYDPNAALSLLKEWPKIEQQPTSIVSFRNILIKRLEEEKRISEIVHRLSQQLQYEKEKTSILQKKVDDIKDMEKTLIRRNIPHTINEN